MLICAASINREGYVQKLRSLHSTFPTLLMRPIHIHACLVSFAVNCSDLVARNIRENYVKCWKVVPADGQYAMKLTDNERKFLQAIDENCFATIAQVTQYCGFQRAMGYHYFRSLSLGGLIDGFELTYLGHKMLNGEEIVNGDDMEHINIRLPEVRDTRKH